MARFARVLVCASLLAVLLPTGAASAHSPLPRDKYSCFNPRYTLYADRDLHIRADQGYAFRKSGELLGTAGSFRHPGDSSAIRFTSGYLSNGWRASHSVTNGEKTVWLKRYVNGKWTVRFRCSPQSGGSA